MSTQDYLDQSSAKNAVIDQRGELINTVDAPSASTHSTPSTTNNQTTNASDIPIVAPHGAYGTGDAADTLGTAGSHPPVHYAPGTAEERPKLPRHGCA
ncbi:hypothetical protein HK104_009243 [Borealophlyctis nickersoniae]|nr:hypothetical protein HK104_009243 [Borealophlyctis nickersoniae]